MRAIPFTSPLGVAASRAAATLGAIALLATVSSVFAAPTTDQNAGVWTDLYQDNAGVASGIPETFGIRHDPFARLITLADNAAQACRVDPCAANEAPGRYGQMATLPIAPVSFDGWRRAYLKFTASQLSDVELRFLAPDGTVYGPFTLLESDDPAFSRMVDLQEAGKAVPPTVGSGRLLFQMRERVVVQGVADTAPNRPADDPADVRIRPTLQSLRATWTPRSVVRVAVEAPTSTCSNNNYTVRVRVAVSLVRAENLVVWSPFITPAADQFGLTYPLQFRGASNNGQYTSTNLVIGGTTIPANSVYWNLGAVDAGNTFVVSYNAAPPTGTRNTTTYTTTAEARATNASPATAPTPVSIVTQSSPSPVVRKSVTTAYLINNRFYTDGGRTLTYNLFVANHEIPPSTCTESYYRAVVYDNVSDLVQPATGNFGSVFTGNGAAAFTISDGGLYTENGTTLNGVSIPPRSIYWDLGNMAVGTRRNLTFSVNLKTDAGVGGPLPRDHRIMNTAHLRSGVQTPSSDTMADVYIGIPNTPSGTYAKGDKIRGSAGISAGNDNWQLSVGYGDPITFLMYARNNGASQLANNVFVDKIPADTTFSSAFLPSNPGGTIYYHTGGANNAPESPPDFTVATGSFGPSWTTIAPANAASVRWVGFSVPRLASPYFPVRINPEDPNSQQLSTAATAEITVTVNQPQNGCPLMTVNNRGLFQTYGYVGVGQTNVTPIPDIGGFVINDEPVQVKPLVPSFEFMNVSASPNALINSGNVTFGINVPNRLSGGVETDTALDAVVTITMPRMSLNGVLSHVPFVSAIAPNGTVDLAGLPNQIVVRYPSIAPDQTRSISVTVNVPSGFVSGQSIGLTASATASDDVCGPINASAGRSVVVTGNPYLTVAKRATLGVAARGSEVEYVLSYTNIGDAVSTRTWIVDKVPAFADLAWAGEVSNGGQVWFSDKDAPLLPATMRAETPVWTDALVRQNFARGSSGGDGRIYPPSNMNRPTWVAFLVDNNNLNPAQFPSSGLSTVRWGVEVSGEAEVGDIVRNEAAIFSSELLTAISNETATIVSDDPSLDVLRTCPEVLASGEDVTYRFQWVNNSTNDDYDVRFIEQLPSQVTFIGSTHTWNAASSRFSAIEVPPSLDPLARTVTWNVSEAIDPTGDTAIESFEGGEVAVTVRIDPATPSGTFLDLGGLALATDFTRELSLSLATGCRVLVENADLFVRLAISESQPVSGETVAYNVVVSNEGANVAANTVIRVTLPVGVTWVPGSPVLVTTPGWSFSGGSTPNLTTVGGRQVLTWSVATNNALIRTGQPAGRFPGRSGDVNLSFTAKVADSVVPETTLTANVAVTTVSGEDQSYPNTATVTAVTPLPNPYVQKTGPGFAQPGDAITYRLRYGNLSRQSTGGVLVVDKLYDSAPVDGNADVTFVGLTANNGELVYFHDAPLNGARPAFSPANPAQSGWRTAVGTQRVNWIALYRPNLAGQAGPFSVFVDVALRAPVTGREPQAGASIPNVATVELTTPNGKDQDATNNTATVITRTPGVDIAAELLCTPEGAFPGGIPGQDASVTLELKNNGTVTAYGLKLAWTPGEWFEVVSDDASEVMVETTSGASSNAVDENNAPVTGRLVWTKQGNTWVLGDTNAASATWYRKVGLPAGHRVRITVQGKVALALVSGSVVAHDLTVATDYRFDFDPQAGEVEEITNNNASTCTTTIFRADPMVIKTASGVGKAEPFTTGDRIEYSIEYNNIGAAPADGVFIEDYLPEDISFVTGSFQNLPEGTEVRYDDGSGAYAYTPVGASGDADPNVRGFRVSWAGAMPAPAGATFRQDREEEFETGTFESTTVSADGERVVVSGRRGGNRGAYLTPAIPTDETASVVEWGRIVVKSLVEAEGASVTVSVLDADTGETIATGLVPDPSGAIDMQVDAAQHQRIRLRADLLGAGLECSGVSSELLPLELEFRQPPYSYAYGCAGPDTAVGYIDMYDTVGESYGAVWTFDGEDSTAELLPRFNTYDYAYHSLEDGVIIGDSYDPSWNFGYLAAWHKVDGTWSKMRVPEPPMQDRVDYFYPETWSSTGIYGFWADFDDGSRITGAYHRDDAGEWLFTEMPDYRSRRCQQPLGLGKSLILRCLDETNNTWKPVEFRPDQPADSSVSWLTVPANTQFNGGQVMQSEVLFAAHLHLPNEGFQLSHIYEFQDTGWVVKRPEANGFRDLYITMFESPTRAYAQAIVTVNGSNWWTAAELNRGEDGVWRATQIPLPPGLVYGVNLQQVYPTSMTRDGELILYTYRLVPEIGWDNSSYIATRGANGQWTYAELSTTEVGARHTYAYQVSTLGLPSGQSYLPDVGRWTYLTWVPQGPVGPQRTWRPVLDSSINQSRYHIGVQVERSTAFRQRQMACGVALLQGNNTMYYYSEDALTGPTYTPIQMGYPEGVVYSSRGSIEGGVNGSFYGYNEHETQEYAVLFAPDGDYGLEPITLPKHPDALGSWHYARWVSPDQKHVVGLTYMDAVGTVPVLWTRNAQGEYDVSLLPGAGDDLNRGEPYDDFEDGTYSGTLAGVRGQAMNANRNTYRGLWFYRPDKPVPFLWVTPRLPGVATLDQNIDLMGGGEDFAVVRYQRRVGEGVVYSTVIIERDPQSEDGVRFIDLPRPEGLETREALSLVAETISPFVLGAFVPQDTLTRSFVWRRGATGWEYFGIANQPEGNLPRLASRTTYGALDLPIIHGVHKEFPLVPRNDIQDGIAYQVVPPATLDGMTFRPWRELGDAEASPRHTSIIAQGVMVGLFEGGGAKAYGVQVLEDDLTWTPAILPGLEDDDSEQLNVDFAAPGPILYGQSYFGERDWRWVAWYFPDGDYSNPQIVDLSTFMGVTGTGDNVEPRNCYFRRYNYSKTDASGFARSAMYCDADSGRTHLVISPSANGIEAFLTDDDFVGGRAMTSPDSLAIPTYYGNAPIVIGCTKGGGVAIDATQVLYRTDVNPSFQYRVEVPNVCQTSVQNTAAIFTSSPQVTASNDRSEVESTIETVDIEVDARADRGTVEVGDTIQYTLDVTNRGPGTATNVRLEAYLPDGAGGPNPRIIRRNLGTLAAGQTLSFNESVEVTTEEPFLPLNASVVATTASIECDTADNAETVTVLTGSLPNVAIALSGPSTWAVGQTATYTATVINDGNSTASGVTLVVNLPQEGEVDEITFDGQGEEGGPTCSVAGYVLTCQISTLTALSREGSPFEVTVVMTNPVCEAAGQRRPADATVLAALDANTADNTARLSTDIVAPSGRFVVSGVSSRSTVETGDDLTLFFHYTNTGSAAVSGASIEARIPAGTTFKSEGTTPGFTVQGDRVTWPLPSVLAGRGGRVALALTASGAAPMTLSSRVDMRLGEEANACPVGADVAVGRITAPGLHVTKRASAAAGCGEPVQWLITVTNTSATTWNNLVITDTVPAQSPYITGSIQGPGASAAGAPVLSWTIPSLAPGRAVTLGFRSQPPASSGALFSNVARVERAGELVAQSAPAVVWATCNGGALRVAKSWDAGCVVSGQTVNVQVTATNTTPSALTAITLTDALPQGVSFVASASGATFEAASGHVVQLVPSIAAGQTVTMRYTATVSGAPGDLVLDAAVSTGGGVQPQASNPVTSVVQDCNDNDPCTVDACVLFVGCVNTLTPIPGIADAECNGVDDNCNGLTDDGWVVTDTSCGTGVCARTGQLVCPPGATEALDTCNAPAPAVSTDTSCNGLDDDCDGPVDEDFASRDYNCGDFCSGTVPTSCVEGEERWDCSAAAQAVTGQACDDNDACSDESTCDGQGVCRPRRFISCSDDNVCTRDTCDAQRGCVYEPLSEVSCNDNDLCTDNDVCVAGTCTGTTRPCAPGNECQADGVCNPATGVCDYATLPGDHPVPIGMNALADLGEASAALDLNALGMVVGWAETESGSRHAVLWLGAAQAALDLTPTAYAAEATAIDDTGLVVGTMQASAGAATSAFAYRQTMVPLFSGTTVTVAAPGGGVVAGTADGMLYVSVGGNAAATAVALPAGASQAVVHQVGAGGHVVGRYEREGNLYAFRWHAGVLSTLSDTESEAVAVNAAGDAVGWVRDGEGFMVAHLFRADGTSLSLGTSSGDESYAVALTDLGLVVGNATSAEGEWHGVTWTAAGGLRDLGTLGRSSDARLVSAAGFVAGTSTNTFGVTSTVLWLPDGTLYAVDLEGATSSRPVALSDSGVIAGVLTTPVGDRAFVWDFVRGTEDLGTLGGFTATSFAMDAAGRVVGASNDREGLSRAFITGLPETTCVICDSDTDPPVLFCPQTPNPLECVDGKASGTLGQASVSDACGRPVTTTDDAPEDFPVGATVVTWTATDSEGNSSSCTSTVIVRDTAAPTLDCPETLALTAPTGACTVEALVPAVATDVCDGEVAVLGPNGPATTPVVLGPGLTDLTFTAIDSAGHQASCTTAVEVTVANTLVIDCDPELTVEAPADFCGYPEALVADVIDGCGSDLEVTTASDSFPLGMTDVTFEANNAIGESSICTTRLTVVDVTPPTLDCGIGGQLRRLPTAFAPTAADACGTSITLSDARCLATDGANAIEVTDGCELTIRDGAISVESVPVFLDGEAIAPTALRVAWRVVATDPSGNEASIDCEASLDLFDRDRDRDGVVDLDDNCPDDPNADQLDTDLDGVGDVCDATDGDGLTAQGSGGCQGGGLPLSLVFAAGVLVLLARRRALRSAPRS